VLCPVCRLARLVEIEMTLGGRPVVMASCSECGVRWREPGSGSIDLAKVLAMAASTR
jgi:hypothetical protein